MAKKRVGSNPKGTVTVPAGECALTGEPLEWDCLTAEVLEVNRVRKGVWQIVRSDGTTDRFEIEAPTRKDALIEWYAQCYRGAKSRADRIAQNLEEAWSLHDARVKALELKLRSSVCRGAVRTVAKALRNDGVVEIDCYTYTSGGMVPQGRVADMQSVAGMLGYVTSTHQSVDNKRYLIIGQDVKEVGQIKARLG